MAGTYRTIVRDYERRFAHKVRLPNARLWRMHHVEARLDHLKYGRDVGSWHTGNEIRGDFAGVWGFTCPVQAAALQAWSEKCGIDWSIPPEDQIDQPPRPKRKAYDFGGPSRRPDNLHTVATSGHPLGVACKACGHRALVSHEALGAHSGNMKQVRALRLKCACGSREWEHKIFHTPEQVAAFLAPIVGGIPTF